MDPNDPLLARVQSAIKDVLTKNHTKLALDVRGQVEEVKRIKLKREESGVELYTVQQQLAKLQMSLEQAHEQFNIMSQMRMGSEEDNQQISDAYGSRKGELQEQRNKLQKYEVELDKVNLTLRQVENYNQQMRDEIAVTRRATYKAEADIQQLEEKQKWQDLYIDGQHDKIKRLEEQLALYDAQYDSQKQETKAAADTLHEAAEELQAEVTFIEHLLEEVKEKRARLNEKYVMLKKSLDQTDVELHNVAKDVDAVNADAKEVDKEWVKVHAEKTGYEEKIEATLSEQTTFERYASGEQKDAKKVHEEAAEKEVQVSQLQNELARIRVDALNTLAHNNALKDTRNTILKDLDEKEGLIDQIDVEIARKNTLIERKQVDIDKLNKRYEALTSGTEEENMGPLEATIHNYTKEIGKKTNECSELKRTWMKHQTELVAVTIESNEQAEVNDSLKSEVAILFQQRIRLDNSIAAEDKQIQTLRRNISNLRGE